MAPVSEYGFVPGRAGVDLTDLNSPAAKAIDKCLDTVLRQPGALRGHWAAEHENPSNARLFADWESLDAHIKYTMSGDFLPMKDMMDPYFDMAAAVIKHVSFDPYPPTPYLLGPGSGVTEVFQAWFPADYSAEEKATVTASIQSFVDAALKTSPDFKGAAKGWSLETDMPIPDSDGQTGTLHVALVAWTSLEGHMRFRETPPFKDNIHVLRELPRCIKAGMYHVSCNSKEAASS